MEYSAYLIDAILVLIFALVIIHTARIGFSRALAGIVAWIAASVIALNFCAPVSERLYLYLFQDRVIASIEENIHNQGGAAETMTVTTAVLQDLPEVAVKAAESIGIDVEALTMQSKDIPLLEKNVAQTLEREVVGPIVQAALKAAMFLLMLIVIAAVGRWLLSFVGKAIGKIPGIGHIDRALGAVLGILKAAFMVAVLAILLKIAAEFTPPEATDLIEQSKLVTFVQQSPFAGGFFI